MCLAIPGEILDCAGADALHRTARVRFGGIVKSVSLALTPAARPGGYVMVHAGFAIAEVDRAEAKRLFEIIGDDEELPAGEAAG